MHFSHLILLGIFLIPGSFTLSAEKTKVEKYRESASRKEGNLELGRKIFQSERALCSECHSVDGSSKSVGPDLFAAGDKFSRADLIKSIIEPSSSIMTGYDTTVIETKDQKTFTGILKSTTKEEITLSNLGNKITTILKSNIKKQYTNPVSLMPAGLHAKLELQEFTDLIAYLESLKQPQSEGLNRNGTPEKIEALSKQIKLLPFFGKNIDLEKPVWFGQHPVIVDSFVIVEKSRASVSLLKKNKDGIEKKIPFVAIPDEVYVTNDEGLLGFAFHPEFSENRKYYLMYETKKENYRGMAISERIASEDFLRDSGKPTRKILEFEVATQFHHGGGIEFGPDGYLYIGMGDGGPQEDPLGHAQDLESFSGKILRIDINKKEDGKFYSIPKENPFNNHPNKKVLREIYVYGLRQPWRFSFDSANGDLWVGDVGQNRFEEVSIVRAGENHGWNVYEGFELFSTQYRKENSTFIPPIISFRRSHGVSITGGYVIRSKTKEKSSFEGVYICADYQSKKIWGLTQNNRKLRTIRQIGQCPDRIVAFGRDRSHNLYAIGYDKGTIYKLDFSEASFK
ncbi:MAG: PQQ-dependent sugar dehydrogenase [Verrucomicrobiales bacterium]|nr:PQQ-dependent sugar dehydrogenase [Verrucomicrobiales bacterium]